MTKDQLRKELSQIPGIGKSLATDLWSIGIKQISDLKGQAKYFIIYPTSLQERFKTDAFYMLSGALFILHRPQNQKENLKN